MVPQPTDPSLERQMILAFRALGNCPAHMDHLCIAWAADLRGTGQEPVALSLDDVLDAWNRTPSPRVDLPPYVPMTALQHRLAANLQHLRLLAVDHRLTVLGQAVIGYALSLQYPFLGVRYPDDEEPAWLMEPVPALW